MFLYDAHTPCLSLCLWQFSFSLKVGQLREKRGRWLFTMHISLAGGDVFDGVSNPDGQCFLEKKCRENL